MIVMFRRMLCMLLLCLLWVPAYGEEASPPIVNLIASPEASFHLDDQAQLLTIVYPNIHGSDCCILMYGGEVWMVDCSTDDQATALVVPVLEKLGVTQVDTAFNSHPHNDHITGFEYIGGQANIHTLMIAFDSRYNAELRRTLHRLGSGVQTVRVHDGQVLTMGDGGVTLTVIQREGTGYTTNDLSALLKVTCGGAQHPDGGRY